MRITERIVGAVCFERHERRLHDDKYNEEVSLPILRDIGRAFRTLNPHEVQSLANRPITFGILAADELVASRILSLLVPPEVSDGKAREAARSILRLASEDDFARCDVGFCEEGLPHPPHFYPFNPNDSRGQLNTLLDDNEDLWLPLGRLFLGLRDPIVERLIWKVSKENAYFTLATALPNVVPSLIVLPWAVGEFASDTAFLTGNQVRMAFLIAGASDAEIGYSEQRGQIGSIVAAAFGWRSLARGMVAKVPAGGGLLSKGLISFAGTYVVGKGIEQFLRFGRGLTRQERKEQYALAFERGRETVQDLIERLTGRLSMARSV